MGITRVKMRWLGTILICLYLGPSWVQSNLEFGLTNAFLPQTTFLLGPMEVPCNESLCTGPLAELYCHGEILQNSWQFGLQKTCPGDKLRVPAKEVLEKFQKLSYPMSVDKFRNFCEESFEQVNYLEVVNLTDWRIDPDFLKEISNEKQRKLASELNERWKRLARQFTSDVLTHPDMYPLLPVQNPFIVPGGRFDVYFYWDTYWIIKGLLVSKMYETTKGIIDNFSNLVTTLGYIPNSGNIQLTRRSQPPLFPHMVWEYTKATGTYDKKWLDSMKMEMEFWEKNRTIEVDGHILFAYKTLSNCPRPENFRGDYSIGMNTTMPSEVWRGISSACESGWDFSSRWMQGDTTAALSNIHTDQIVPVDLNVLMANNYRYMALYAEHFLKIEEATSYRRKLEKISEAIQQVLWDDKLGVWLDYDVSLKKKNSNFYPSNVYPLMIPGFEKYADKVENYLKKSGALKFAGGIPSSLPSESLNQQWDFPNVWAPNQHFVIQSFLATSNSFLLQEAAKQAQAFIETVYNGMYKPSGGLTGGVWEKYDARSTAGAPGTGGEYIVQEGFGWTNGAVLDLIWTFRNNHNRLEKSSELELETSQQSALVYAAAGFCAMVAIVMVLKGLIKYKSRQASEDAEAGALLLGENDEDDD
ncbi:unnamed protein product [Caenorhabditis nigoni]